MIEAVRILLLIIFAVTDLVVYMLILNILTDRGHALAGFRTHVNNLLEFSTLIDVTKDRAEKRHYKFLIRTYIGSLILLIATVLTYFIKL